MKGGRAPPASSSIRASLQLGSLTLCIVKGDITNETTDAIVNAANGQLWLGGGVAGAIARKAGTAVERECRDYTRANGPVAVGGVVRTGAGKLSCKCVLHTVGPVFKPGQDNDSLLHTAVFNTYLKAAELGLTSLSLPAISSGIFGFPKDRCANIMLRTLLSFLEQFPSSSLSLIRLINIDEPTVHSFLSALSRLPPYSHPRP